MAQEEFPGGATGATGAGSQPMATITSSTRHSRDDFDQQAQRPVDPRDEPPSYDTLFEPLALRRKYNIQPREDEGRETLPPYSSAISIQNVFLKRWSSRVLCTERQTGTGTGCW
ncbi:PH domain-containing protein [Diplocarpon rosae]|nr:PH domain-containing protein [Diplocarpon rosae]